MNEILASPIFSGVLLTVGMLGLLLEMQTLHGVAGTVGILALGLFFGVALYDGSTNAWVIGLAMLGLFGILWELHVVPGHGAPGVLGGLALLLAVLLSFGVLNLFIALETVATSLVTTVVLFAFAVRMFPENAWMQKMVFQGVQGREYVTSSDFSALRGARGTALSFLRPSGVALLDGRRIDVLTEGEFIHQGTPICVTRVEGARIFVEPVVLPELPQPKLGA